jgi:hypothetical protein
VAKWRHRAQLLALTGHKLILEDGPELVDEESQEDEHGEDMSAGIIIITFTREGPVGFHQPRQIAPRKGPRVLVATLRSLWIPAPGNVQREQISLRALVAVTQPH